MYIKIAIATGVLFFGVQSLRAQDNQHSRHDSIVKDTSHKKPLVIPKFPRSGYVAVMGGLGAPAGSFASGLAASGGSVFSLSAGFPGIISHCGIAFKFDDGTNPLNQNQFMGSLGNMVGNNSYSYTMSSFGAYSYEAFMGGLYLTYPVKKFAIDARILMGTMIAEIPSVSVNVTDQANESSGNYTQAATSSAGFAFDFGIEARYTIRPDFCVILSADYLHADPSFKEVVTGSELSSSGAITPGTGSGQEMTTSQSFSLFNLAIGVGYTISAQKPSPIKAQ